MIDLSYEILYFFLRQLTHMFWDNWRSINPTIERLNFTILDQIASILLISWPDFLNLFENRLHLLFRNDNMSSWLISDIEVMDVLSLTKL
jgi:hypothetical protein